MNVNNNFNKITNANNLNYIDTSKRAPPTYMTVVGGPREMQLLWVVAVATPVPVVRGQASAVVRVRD